MSVILITFHVPPPPSSSSHSLFLLLHDHVISTKKTIVVRNFACQQLYEPDYVPHTSMFVCMYSCTTVNACMYYIACMYACKYVLASACKFVLHVASLVTVPHGESHRLDELIQKPLLLSLHQEPVCRLEVKDNRSIAMPCLEA